MSTVPPRGQIETTGGFPAGLTLHHGYPQASRGDLGGPALVRRALQNWDTHGELRVERGRSRRPTGELIR
jgi:hypothetical protein